MEEILKLYCEKIFKKDLNNYKKTIFNRYEIENDRYFIYYIVDGKDGKDVEIGISTTHNIIKNMFKNELRLYKLKRLRNEK